MTPCPVCGSSSARLLHRSRRNGLRVGRCKGCGVVSVLDAPDAVELAGLYASADHYELYLAAQATDALRQRHIEALSRLKALLPDVTVPRLFDVGAGAGDFVALARSEGFEVAGNEISGPAIDMCRDRYGIELHSGDMHSLDLDGQFDAMTMWCVLAHVADPVEMLGDALRLLRPGGVLYFHTPRWCSIDRAGLALTKASAGYISQVTDRRVNLAHLRLFTAPNLTALLSRVGFEPKVVQPVAAYSLNTRSYVESLRLPPLLRRPIAGAADLLIRQGWFARNILDVYAEKPAMLPMATANRRPHA